MTAPKQPSKRSTQIKSVATGGEPPTPTPSEMKLLVAYRAMDNSRQRDMAGAMEAIAKQFPRRALLALKLVMGARNE
jgi:hypothetical protein